jgi:hypothetical protein
VARQKTFVPHGERRITIARSRDKLSRQEGPRNGPDRPAYPHLREVGRVAAEPILAAAAAAAVPALPGERGLGDLGAALDRDALGGEPRLERDELGERRDARVDERAQRREDARRNLHRRAAAAARRAARELWASAAARRGGWAGGRAARAEARRGATASFARVVFSVPARDRRHSALCVWFEDEGTVGPRPPRSTMSIPAVSRARAW